MKARTVALAIALLCANPIPHAQAFDNRIYAPNELILGMTYGDWTAAWWQFYFQIPNVNNSHPFVATADNTCNNGNQPAGPVFFLTGVSLQAPQPQVVRSCTVPAGSPILFPIANQEWSNLELQNFSGADLRAALLQLVPLPTNAKKALPKLSDLTVSLDGVNINFLSEFHFQSPVFFFTAPSQIKDFIFYSGFSTSGPVISVSDGYWIAIKPLPAGQHTLSFSATLPGIININMLYHLNVQ
ncbi:hypothetical protein [Burkholderia sp. Ac-20353]|uniref:hypothetical protein n=1 Tax=Burkholderia sp. Ac-20353 TaxID=2703894 RepID=UPI00197B5E16|nr:hypothetical protein [Burkholderia sp. Ac-20353]MBN3786746.1 hypothetical protein [Burkholderia sp. Ac-20353]